MMQNLPEALYTLQQGNTGNPSGRRCGYDLHVQRYPATMEQSKKEKHPVMRYAIPGSSLCYTFEHLRTNSSYKVYRCTGCRIDNVNTMIAVIDNQFCGSPCMLEHRCRPVKLAEEKVERLLYEKCKKIKSNKLYAGASTRVVWQDIEDYIENNCEETQQVKDDMLLYYHRSGFADREKTQESDQKTRSPTMHDGACTGGMFLVKPSTFLQDLAEGLRECGHCVATII